MDTQSADSQLVRHMKRCNRILDAVVPCLPVARPTYLMGVGTPANILEAVDRGVDFFDCVYPSRNGRHGHVYTKHGKLNLFNAKFELDERPIEEAVSARPAAVIQELISVIC